MAYIENGNDDDMREENENDEVGNEEEQVQEEQNEENDYELIIEAKDILEEPSKYSMQDIEQIINRIKNEIEGDEAQSIIKELQSILAEKKKSGSKFYWFYVLYI